MSRPKTRYLGVILLLVLMLYIHLYIILIHPLLFIVWPMSLWLLIDLVQNLRDDKRLIIFGACFLSYIVITQLLVVEHSVGIFFDQELFPNMSSLTNAVLALATIIYLYDVFIVKRDIRKITFTYIGFSSIIPWIGPAIIEAIILIRWGIEGTFIVNTLGKGIGAANLDDILFFYGFRNFTLSILTSILVISVQNFRVILMKRRLNLQEKHEEERENMEWRRRAWENPATLLSEETQRQFKEKYGHLPQTEQKRLLREKILPEKGINLLEPKD